MIKLLPTEAQVKKLEATLKAFEDCCDWMNTEIPSEAKSHVVIHHLAYYEARSRFNLPANLVVKAISRVAFFRKTGTLKPPQTSIDYDNKTCQLSSAESVNLSTVKGREKILCAPHSYTNGCGVKYTLFADWNLEIIPSKEATAWAQKTILIMDKIVLAQKEERERLISSLPTITREAVNCYPDLVRLIIAGNYKSALETSGGQTAKIFFERGLSGYP